MKATVNATCGFDTQAPAHRISDRQLIHESHEFSIDQWRGDPRKILLEPRPAINEAADTQISIKGFTEARVDSDGRPTAPNRDRKSVVSGKRVSVRVDLGGGLSRKKKIQK